MSITKLLALKVNLVGTIFISLATSISTVASINWWNQHMPNYVSANNMEISASKSASLLDILDCKNGVYSPVQKTCVDQKTFDKEMERLFSALGLKTDVYQNQNN